MTSFFDDKTFARKDFLKGAGALIVAISVPLELMPDGASAQTFTGQAYPVVPLDQLDSYLKVNADGTVIGAAGKVNAGMGVDTAFAQILAEELNIAFDNVTILLGDTATTPDQGGTGGSNGVIQAGTTLRNAGAEAMRFLLDLASQKLNVPVAKLTAANSVISGGGKSITYGDLIGGQQFNIKVSGTAPTKAVGQYSIVGKGIQRPEIANIVVGKHQYIVDFKFPGMVHARAVRPPWAGATLVSVNKSQKLPGNAQVLTKGNYVAVVAETEWHAIQAAKQLKAQWQKPSQATFFKSYEEMYARMPTMPLRSQSTSVSKGSVDVALASAHRTVQATYESAFQSHASMGPGCAVADIRGNGGTIWFGGQKPYRVKLAVADLLSIPAANIRAVWLPGPGSYGANDADDVVAEAAWISQQIGRPVRLQWMRNEGIAWDPKGPPAVITLRAGIDNHDRVTAWDWLSYEFSGTQRAPGALIAGDTLIGQVSGSTPIQGDEYGFPSETYSFPNVRKIAKILNWDQALGTGLRTAHFRDPNGPQTTFASESFVDEVAAALGKDPVQFRLSYLTGYRDTAAIEAVAKAAKWDTRPSPRNHSGKVLARGRGIAYAPRGATIAAVVARVEVNRNTGHVRVTHLFASQDAGLIINPSGIEGTIEANLIQAMSRALYEQANFDQWNVTSVDWDTYPIVDITQVPEVKVVLINRPDLAPSGSGEPTTRPMAAAIANAIFDATGVRVRRQPFTPHNVLAAMKKH